MELEYDVEYTNTILLVDNEKSILNSLKRLSAINRVKMIE